MSIGHVRPCGRSAGDRLRRRWEQPVKTAPRSCECCEGIFKPSGLAKKGICNACLAIARDIIRERDPEFSTSQSVFARMLERLRPLLTPSPHPRAEAKITAKE